MEGRRSYQSQQQRHQNRNEQEITKLKTGDKWRTPVLWTGPSYVPGAFDDLTDDVRRDTYLNMFDDDVKILRPFSELKVLQGGTRRYR